MVTVIPGHGASRLLDWLDWDPAGLASQAGKIGTCACPVAGFRAPALASACLPVAAVVAGHLPTAGRRETDEAPVRRGRHAQTGCWPESSSDVKKKKNALKQCRERKTQRNGQ